MLVVRVVVCRLWLLTNVSNRLVPICRPLLISILPTNLVICGIINAKLVEIKVLPASRRACPLNSFGVTKQTSNLIVTVVVMLIVNPPSEQAATKIPSPS